MPTFQSALSTDLYVIVGAIRSTGTARAMFVAAHWFNAAAVDLGTGPGAQVTDSADWWTYSTGVLAAPVGATQCRIELVGVGDLFDEGHYLDCCGIFPGDTLGYQLEVLSDGPSAYFPLTDGPGSLTAANAVGSGAGTVTGGVTFGQPGVVASDPSQTAALFDGSTGYVTGPSIPAGTALTLECWINADPTQPTAYGNRVLSAGGGGLAGAEFTISGSGGGATFTICDGPHTAGASTPASLPAGSWHHVVGVYDGTSSVSMYLDGVLAQSVSSTVTSVPSVPLVMSRFSGGGDYFSGALTQVAVYPTALTAARVQAHYQAAYNTTGQIVQKWTRGGLAGTTTAAVTYTDENNPTPVIARYGNAIQLPAPSQEVTVIDYEAIPSAPRTYVATVSATV